MSEKFYIHLFDWGDVAHSEGDVAVDREFYSEIQSAYLLLAGADGDRPRQYIPIKRQHENDGFVYGRITDLFSTDEKPAPAGFSASGIYVEVEPSKPLIEWREDGLVADWSPGFGPFKDPHTGREFEVALREVSFVSEGHLRNTEKQSPHYRLSAEGFVTLSNDNPKESTMEEEENGTMERIEALEELVGELAEGVKGLMETMSSLMEKDGEEYEEDGEVDEEETNMASEDKEMSARLEKLEKQLAAEKGLRIRAEANAKLDATGLEFAADRREALVALSGVNEKAFAATVAILSEHAAKARKMTAEANDPFAFATQEVGAAGHSPTEPRDGFRAFCAEMKKSGVKTQHEALKQLAAERRINLMDGDDVAKKSLVLAEIWPGN